LIRNSDIASLNECLGLLIHRLSLVMAFRTCVKTDRALDDPVQPLTTKRRKTECGGPVVCDGDVICFTSACERFRQSYVNIRVLHACNICFALTPMSPRGEGCDARRNTCDVTSDRQTVGDMTWAANGCGSRNNTPRLQCWMITRSRCHRR
jgi:hypothetical protein